MNFVANPIVKKNKHRIKYEVILTLKREHFWWGGGGGVQCVKQIAHSAE